MKLSKPQIALLRRMGDTPNALRNGDEGVPQWWIEGSFAANKKVAESLIRRGLVALTGKWGGQPGVLGFTITPAGRTALHDREPESSKL